MKVTLPAQDSSSIQYDRTRQVRIDAGLLIPGRGEPLRSASLIFHGSTITHVGPTASLPSPYTALPVAAHVPVLMPGLWDCHVHFWGNDRGRMEELASQSGAASGVRIARSLVATLNAGYTSVRELGGYGVDVASAVDSGWIPGPKIYGAAAILSQTGGHGDVRSVPLHSLPSTTQGRGGGCCGGGGDEQLPILLCDGPDACRAAVRQVVRRGARVVKIATSGGISTEGDDLFAQQFADDEIRAVTEEAARQNLAVAAHAHGKAGIMAALRNGVRTIEHASELDDEAVALAREKGAIVVPTRGAVEAAMARDDVPPESRDKVRQVYEMHARSYALAVRSGLNIAMGSDVVASSEKIPWVHGRNGDELKFAVEVGGLSPLKAIEAATAAAPATLGPKAPRSGWLREGYDADFIALDESPLDDIRILGDPRNVKAVWKGGKQFKREGRPIGILADDES